MKKSICIVLIILLTALMGTMLILDKHQESKQNHHVKELQNEAEPYEKELSQIRLELEEKKAVIESLPDVSGTMIGFVPNTADDIASIKEVTDGHSFTPLVLLDCAKDEATLQSIAQRAVQEGYDLILAGITFDASVVEKADAIKAFLTDYFGAQDPVFLLRNTYDTEGNRAILKQHGYEKLVRYSDSLSAGVDDAGIPYLAYGFIRSSGAYGNYINQAAAAKSFSITVFDFADIQRGAIGKTDIANYIEAVDKKVSAEEMLYTNLKSAFQAVAEGGSISSGTENDYEKYEKKQQDRIKELEEIIAEIYNRWDEY